MSAPTKKPKRVTLAVTKDEFTKVKMVARMLRTDSSNLLRKHSLEWVLEEAERMKRTIE